MEKTIYKISEIANVIMGTSPKSENYNSDMQGVPFLQGITTFGFKHPEYTTWTTSYTKLAEPGSILFAVRAPVGDVNICKVKTAIGRGLASINSKNKDNEFLYYLLMANKRVFESYSNGTVYDAITGPQLKKTKIFVPKKNQFKIGHILSTYDNFIEANVKRINILNKLTEIMYKEWFVRFKFPGHEKAQFKVQNPHGWMLSTCELEMRIPSGWKYDELISIAEFKRGKNITAAEMVEGEIPVISAGLNPSGYHNEANVFGKNLTVSSSGANAGYLSYHLSDIWAADCSYYQNDKNLWFVYNALKFLQPVISNMQVGSAQPHVYAKTINKLSTIIPPNELIELYCEKVNPIYEQIRLLTLVNENLVKQRNALLPRLMSGKLNLEGKEIV